MSRYADDTTYATGQTARVEDRDEAVYEVYDESYTRRRDRVRWGPVWAGLVVALATYLLIQLILVAADAVDLADPSTSDGIWSALAAIVGFFIGGVTVGMTAMWRGTDDGVIHGVVLWAVGLVALVVLATAGGGIALGSIDTTQAFEDLDSQDVPAAQANDDAQDAAGRALAVVAAALVASAAGGAAGAKLWPRREETVDLRRSRTASPSTTVTR